MNIEIARRLKPGHLVTCPADGGEPAYSGRVAFVGANEYRNDQGAPYVWVTVERVHLPRTKHVWPSNRLGAILR
jgi:hypothetical protein